MKGPSRETPKYTLLQKKCTWIFLPVLPVTPGHGPDPGHVTFVKWSWELLSGPFYKFKMTRFSRARHSEKSVGIPSRDMKTMFFSLGFNSYIATNKNHCIK